MKSLLLVLTFLCFANVSFDQNTDSPEQIALNFFVDVIWQNKYPQIKNIYFEGKTDSIITTFGSSCFDTLFTNWDTIQLINSQKLSTIESILDTNHSFSQPKNLVNNKLRLIIEELKCFKKKKGVLSVNNHIKIKSSIYVRLDLFLVDDIIKTTIIELNENMNVKHWCAE